ncbi:hypothetical protein BpHYR1_001348 [Brachionus plicatilis]|uniref:Uncharacterized protein n=1 Tax=Brachionus plicatilis TaxID=10195 RepID=A0A3M7RK48_BRAPC|nr:hypothetical protein BpHYR1_001348 [Brachionus plicatilis]
MSENLSSFRFLSFHPESIKKNKSSYYQFYVYDVPKTVTRKEIFDKINYFKLRSGKLVYLEQLVVDIQTRCPIYRKEHNIRNPEFDFTDRVLIYISFDESVEPRDVEHKLDNLFLFPFQLRYVKLEKKGQYLNRDFNDWSLLSHGLDLSKFRSCIGDWIWAQQYVEKGQPSIKDPYFGKASKTRQTELISKLKEMRNPSKDFELLRPFIIRKKFDDWRDQIVCWYNEWLTKPYENKRKQILIIGDPNSGKTCFIKALLGYFIHQCFTPTSCSYKYAWSGESFVCDKKHASAEKKSCNVPMIFISNEEPKSFTGLEERIFKVFVKKTYHVNNINDFLEFDWSIPEDKLPLRPGQRPVFPMDYVKKITQPTSLVEDLPQFDFNQPITPLSCLSEGQLDLCLLSPISDLGTKKASKRSSNEIIDGVSLEDVLEGSKAKTLSKEDKKKLCKIFESIIETLQDDELDNDQPLENSILTPDASSFNTNESNSNDISTSNASIEENVDRINESQNSDKSCDSNCSLQIQNVNQTDDFNVFLNDLFE